MKRTIVISLFLALALAMVPLAGFAQSAEAGTCAYSHTVKPGETLNSIAAHYGVSPQTLAQVNGISNANWIYVGMVLCIPGGSMPGGSMPGGSMPSSGSCKYHYVKPGETLSGIARYYGVDMGALAQRNSISNPNRIYAGQKLVISCSKPPAPKPMPKPTPKPPYYPPPPQPGDGPSQPYPPDQGACSIMPQQGFGRVWHSNPKTVAHVVGCPTTQEIGFSGTEQVFKNGYVVLDNNSKTIFVMYSNGKWETYPDTWHSGDPVVNHQLMPPPGYYQPEYGIGKMWRNDDNVSQRLGWAKYPQRPVTATRQSYERGQMLWTASRGIFVLYGDGTWKHFD